MYVFGKKLLATKYSLTLPQPPPPPSSLSLCSPSSSLTDKSVSCELFFVFGSECQLSNVIYLFKSPSFFCFILKIAFYFLSFVILIQTNMTVLSKKINEVSENLCKTRQFHSFVVLF